MASEEAVVAALRAVRFKARQLADQLDIIGDSGGSSRLLKKLGR